MNKTFFLSSVLTFISMISLSQNITMNQTLTYINSKLQGNFLIDVRNGNLLLDAIENGEVIKKETILITDLNPEVEYSEKEKALILKCAGGDDCVERKEMFIKKKSYFSRVKIVLPDDETTKKGLQKALLHMIKLVYYPKYENSEPFE